MTRKVAKVRCHLDPKGIADLPRQELVAILRGADELIGKGGRTLLAKILKGSQEKRVLEMELDKSPVYGFFKAVRTEDILAKIDRAILDGYLAIEYDYRLPMLVYTPAGWEIEKDTFSSELLREFDLMREKGDGQFDMEYLKDRNREMIFLLLEKVRETGDPKYIPPLEAWEKIDYKKVQSRIRNVMAALNQPGPNAV